MLRSNLQDAVVFYPTSTALLFCLKLLLPQCRTINSGLFYVEGCMYDFMLSVALLKCFVTTLFSSDNSHSFTSFTIESPKITVTGSFFWRCFRLSGRFLLVFLVRCFYFDCRQNVMFHMTTLWHVNLFCYFECPH